MDLKGPLLSCMYLLLVTHLIQFIFYRRLLSDDGKINMRHKWVWVLHVLIYPYVIYSYFYDRDLASREHDGEGQLAEHIEARLVWIPMDCILTACVLVYYCIHVYKEYDYDSDRVLTIFGQRDQNIFDSTRDAYRPLSNEEADKPN